VLKRQRSEEKEMRKQYKHPGQRKMSGSGYSRHWEKSAHWSSWILPEGNSAHGELTLEQIFS